MKLKKAGRQLAKDFGIILIGVALAIILDRSGAIGWMIKGLGGHELASFISGLFFTSAFTIAPASVALIGISDNVNVHSVAIWGALGAMCGDLILFLFVRDKFAKDLTKILKHSFVTRVARTFHFGFLRWISPIVGAIVIASPLPDEIGLSLMGFARMPIFVLMPLTFLMNALGVYSIVWFARVI